MRYVILSFVIICSLRTIAANNVRLLEPVDLTWPFDNSTLYWGTTQPLVFTKKVATHTDDDGWYAANEFCAGEHGGTHFDAPYHFHEAGWKVGEVPLSRLIAHGVTIDLRSEEEKLKNKAVLLTEHLEQWERTYGSIPVNSVILVKFGWVKHYHDRQKYFGIDEYDDYHFPGISAGAAEWIAKSGKVVGVGLDTPSVDPGRNISAAHRALAKEQIYNLENVKIPEEFPAHGYLLYVMPMKIADGTGAPVRITAVPQYLTDIATSVAAVDVPRYVTFSTILFSALLCFSHVTK